MKGISELVYHLGTCRSGRSIQIPDSLTEDLASAFVGQLSIDDQVDFFCVSEYMMLKNERANMQNREVDLIVWVNQAFRIQTERESELKYAQGALSLRTSPDYVRFGKTLALHVDS